jgi:hypothetical protein
MHASVSIAIDRDWAEVRFDRHDDVLEIVKLFRRFDLD